MKVNEILEEVLASITRIMAKGQDPKKFASKNIFFDGAKKPRALAPDNR